jgi:predicted Fe-Mo cluster-binding NifX family protein
MISRIIVPTNGENGLDSQLAEHFGRAPYFTVVDLDTDGKVLSAKSMVNTGEHVGGTGLTHDNILGLKPNAIIVYGMGSKRYYEFPECWSSSAESKCRHRQRGNCSI